MENVQLIFREGSGKGVPYLSGHGFKQLKGDPSAIDLIPEAAGHEPYRIALLRLNDMSTPYFSVGCEKMFDENEEGHWASGYIDLSFNHMDLAQNCSKWFPHFLACSRKFSNWTSGMDVVRVQWELETDVLTDVGGSPAVCTCAVWVVVPANPDKSVMEQTWSEAWKLVIDSFIEDAPVSGMSSIYPLV